MTRYPSRWLAVALVALVTLAGGATLGAGGRAVTDKDITSRLRAGKFAEAEKLARERLAAVERESGPESVEAANVLDLLSEAMRQGGKGGQAEVGEICERAVRIKGKELGKDDPGYAASLYQLGCWHYVNVRYRDALPLLEQSLKIREATLGPSHPDVAASLYVMGAIQTDTGDHAAAKLLVERALKIRRSIDPGSPGVAECLNGLATILVRMGDYADAEPLYRNALAIWEAAWGPTHMKVGTAWNNYSALLYATGDYEGSLISKERALKIRIQALGPDHELVAYTRGNMGMTLAALGRKSDARREYRRAIAIQERRFGNGSAEVGWTLKRLGDTYLAPGEYEQGIPLLKRALSNLESGEGPDHPDVAEAMASLGAARTALGDTAAGNPLNRSALEILGNRLGDQHPEVAFTLTQHAGALMVAGDYGPALEEALRGEEVSREHLRLTCRTMPERAALAYASARPAGGRLALSILGHLSNPDPGTIARAWDSLIRSRTLVLDEMALRMRMASEAKDPETKRAVENLSAARRHLAHLLVEDPGDAAGSEYRAALKKARENNENAERELAMKNTAFSRDRERARIGLRDVASALPAGAALVAYAATGEGRARSYVAFVARSGTDDASFTPIGSGAKVETCVARWLAAVNAAGRKPSQGRPDPSRATGDSLAALVWSPVASKMEGVSRLYIVGDGAILLVNFDALPVGRSRYLVEQGPVLHYLNSERDLVGLPAGKSSGKGLLALGDPAFDRRVSKTAIARSRGASRDTDHSDRNAWDCGDFRSVQFTKLPSSGVEAREVAGIWGDAAHSIVLTGAAASERAFKADAPGHLVLHLATHGFFLGGICGGLGDATRGIGATAPLTDRPPPKQRGTNPIQLSGLALAGANERASAGPDDEDGILTAEEIASLDLAGTDWAVLSACDTGQGRIQVGEGVLGLRRAFQAAGARTVIMSLWSVDDESTRLWMKALYESRVRKKLDTADAVRQADLHVLRARRAQALSTDPFYWAAFVATGDWR
jgi:CHAT domain-containing protein